MTNNTYAVADKVVVVTGAGTGIGRAIARAFLSNGAKVVAAGRRREPLDEAVADAGDDRALVVTADVAQRADVDALVAATLDRFGRIDIVVSNAGVHDGGGDITEMSDDSWALLRGVNIDGFVHVAQATLPELVKTGGNLVAVSSVSGIAGDWGQAAYNATKHAVNGFVESLALDYGGRGVRINAVGPAFTLTEMTEGMGRDEKALAPFVNRIALGRPGEPDDVAPAVLFLASDDARYITGTMLTVDGGTSASTGQPHVE
ncbi:3-oxoacyl-ACP reductase [Williamsia sp. Leaf354]|jgi:meso-butanediol dehydrogenase/(S,S)-butanediol dehydrogenase/diacetyl reductase|uniref:SDR family NAD(P)-dependent oxidoreductase n=1 Tax=Williamsia sp. Leaf354 TaxID=1736349 RepID=UPI0006FD57B2|nr:SDR family oxidoreductase [Williamsia sp. Leaf354]KQR96484.1 3-oxoacyl-ACP reductase [Williamsia sp. Leaf354]